MRGAAIVAFSLFALACHHETTPPTPSKTEAAANESHEPMTQSSSNETASASATSGDAHPLGSTIPGETWRVAGSVIDLIDGTPVMTNVHFINGEGSFSNRADTDVKGHFETELPKPAGDWAYRVDITMPAAGYIVRMNEGEVERMSREERLRRALPRWHMNPEPGDFQPISGSDSHIEIVLVRELSLSQKKEIGAN